jgi:hypothetical protein
MKVLNILASGLSLVTSAIAVETAVTAPVGFGTLEGSPVPGGFSSAGLQPGMNLVGLRLHHNVVTQGRVAAVGKDFAELTILDGPDKVKSDLPLTAGKTYILEITSGDQAGVIQEITRWQGVRLSLSDDLATAGVKPGDTFSLRPAASLNSVFHPRTTGLLSGENAATADNVLIPQGTTLAEFRRCFLLSLPDGNTGWVDAATLEPVGDVPLVYPDGLIVHRKGDTAVKITAFGEVKTGPTRSVVKPGLNLVATPYPALSDLQALGLENDLQKSDNADTADKVWVSNGISGGFDTYHLTPDKRWIAAGNGQVITEKIPVGSAILIEREGPAALFCLGD